MRFALLSRKASKFKTSVDTFTQRVVACRALSTRPRAPRRLVLRASAKVNLTLEVLSKRPDGYHEIATVMQAIDLSDRLFLEEAGDLSLTVDDDTLPVDDGNLVLRAARLLREASGCGRGAALSLRKRIPIAAGLGGGSSDAAATLMGLNRLWNLRWPRARMAELAVQIGMDVPFFLGRGRALATGRGERLRALPGGGGYALVLVNPKVPLATREVYGRVPRDWRAEPTGMAAMIAALRRRSARGVALALTNSLEALVEPCMPAITRMKAALLAAGALGAAMSGSGPTVFGVARSHDDARRIRARVTRAGWACWAVRTTSAAPIRFESR
jgi:4-diphosphocytidyl-2-C-methyl-D-erythritol kinase